MEEMNELFYRNPYQREFTAVVERCVEGKDGFEIILSDTTFYPEGGGQPGDTGVIDDVRVLDTKRRDGAVVHYTDRPLPEGAQVHGVLNWERRFDHMQHHSGEHIMSGLIHKKFGYDNVGFHMSEEMVTIDFNGLMTLEDALEIEKEANRVVFENKPTHIWFPCKEEMGTLEYRSKKELSGAVRIVEFAGADICACCGTHVERTGEIGLIKVLSLTNHKGGVRIQIICGRKALAHYDILQSMNTEIGNLFSAKPYDTLDAVHHCLEEQESLKQKINELNKRYYHMKAEMLPRKKLFITVEDQMNTVEIRKFCEYLVDQDKGDMCIVLAPKAEGGFNYVIGSSVVDVREINKAWIKQLNGKGGGKAEMVQGSYQAGIEEIKAVMDAWERP